jgi:CysZ protein|tara:strand:+ start:51 stop:755 length:705 start_codon:yes stop_codon:yes gene_type:complete
MKNSDYKNIIFFSFKALLHRSILKLTIISMFLSFAILASVLYAFWNAFPSIEWIKLIFWGFFDDLLNSIWIFIISTLFILLYPPLSTIISGFYLDPISHKVNLLLGNNYIDKSSHVAGIITGIRILGLSIIFFFLILLLKWSLISNIYLALLIQLVASGYILGKEYYEVVALKIFTYEKISLFRKKNFLILNIVGVFCSFLFMIPILNLIAPILSIILMTSLVDKLDKNYSIKK